MRLIDADALKKENERLLHCDFPYLSETTLEELIDEAPTIDAVPVIRCKDCKWWKFNGREYYCDEKDAMVEPCENDFCSLAERKPPQVNPEMVREMKERLEKHKND